MCFVAVLLWDCNVNHIVLDSYSSYKIYIKVLCSKTHSEALKNPCIMGLRWTLTWDHQRWKWQRITSFTALPGEARSSLHSQMTPRNSACTYVQGSATATSIQRKRSTQKTKGWDQPWTLWEQNRLPRQRHFYRFGSSERKYFLPLFPMCSPMSLVSPRYV